MKACQELQILPGTEVWAVDLAVWLALLFLQHHVQASLPEEAPRALPNTGVLQGVYESILFQTIYEEDVHFKWAGSLCIKRLPHVVVTPQLNMERNIVSKLQGTYNYQQPGNPRVQT